jgi:hypothetical protein
MENEFNLNPYNFEPSMIIDEVSNEEYYIGITNNNNVASSSNWKIKKVWKIDTIWRFGFPDGNQSFSYVWNDRFDYNYY